MERKGKKCGDNEKNCEGEDAVPVTMVFTKKIITYSDYPKKIQKISIKKKANSRANIPFFDYYSHTVCTCREDKET